MFCTKLQNTKFVGYVYGRCISFALSHQYRAYPSNMVTARALLFVVQLIVSITFRVASLPLDIHCQCKPHEHNKLTNHHYCDVIMVAMASQITSLTVVYSTVHAGADQRKHQSSASLAFVRWIHLWPVNSPHKGPVTRKMFPFDDAIMMRICRELMTSQQQRKYKETVKTRLNPWPPWRVENIRQVFLQLQMVEHQYPSMDK